MSDWSMYELEDIMWDEFGESDDHIVPHHGGEQVSESVAEADAHKKPRHEVENGFRKSSDSRGSVTKIVLQRKVETAPPLKDGNCPILEDSWSHVSKNVVPASCDPEYMANVTALASQDARMPDNCFKDGNKGSGGNTFCAENPVIGISGAANDSKGCDISLDDISPADSKLGVLENQYKDRENDDLLYYDWSDIGSFEDVDRMFRNCDSTFGQGVTANADELSWFSSSSHTINGLEDTYKLGVQTSCSEPSALICTSEHHDANKNLIAGNYPSTSNYMKSSSLSSRSYADWFDADAEDKGESAPKRQVNDSRGGDEVNASAFTQTRHANSSNECNAPEKINMRIKQLERQHLSKGKKKDRPSEYTSSSLLNVPGQMRHFADLKSLSSVVSAPPIYSSRSDCLNYIHTYSPHAQAEYNFPSRQLPFTQTTSSSKSEYDTKLSCSYEVEDHVTDSMPQCMELLLDPLSKPATMSPKEKMEKLRLGQQSCATLIIEHPHEYGRGRSKTLVQKKQHFQNELEGDSELEDTCLELPAGKIDPSILQESSCMTSVLSHDISLQATSFRQLQAVMNQLDVRAKLCIRDSLYRLARSALQRHSFANTIDGIRERIDRRGIPGAEESKKCPEFMDVETDTNPIDRSIAHLLFHRPSKPATRSVDDAISLESHVINEQIDDPITLQAVRPNQLVCPTAFGGSSNNAKLLRTDQQ